jgi:putative transcriptional regulator
MTHKHHPQADTLICYVAGTLPNAISCVVACHLSLCGDCADHVRRLGLVGGLMLKNLEADAAGDAFTERVAALWSAERLPPSELRHQPALNIDDPLLPRPLARYLGMSGGEIPWKRVVKGVRQYWLKLPRGSGQIRLLRLTPGKLLLEHSHTGMELTLVLQGIYGDHTGDYVRGDVIEWTEGTLHQPRASGDEECVCLIASERTPHFSRLVARLLRPIMGF